MLTPEQLAMRLTGVGGSEIGAVAGLSPYANAFDVYRSKVEGYVFEGNDATERGNFLEPAIASWYAHRTGAFLTERGTLRHPKHPLVIATPDRVANFKADEWDVSIKTANLRMADQWGEEGTDEVPAHYLAQIQWEMGVLGLGWGEIAVLIAGDDLRRYRITFDPELFGMLVEQAERFWRNHVEPKRPPQPDGSDSCGEWLKTRFPKETAPVLQATPEAERWAMRLIEARKALDDAEQAEKEARHHLQALIGDAAGMKGNGWSVSWKRSKDGQKVDWEGLAKAYTPTPAEIAKFTTTKPGPRPFRVTGPKEKP